MSEPEAAVAASFAEAFASHREKLVERLTQEALSALGGTLGAPIEAFRADRAVEVDIAIEALRDGRMSFATESWKRWIDSSVQRGWSASTLQGVLGAMRQVFIDVALELRASGVPDATRKIRAFIRSSSEALYLIDEELRTRVEFLHRKTQIFEALIHHAPDGMGVAATDGTLVYVNPAFERLLGRDDLLGHSVHDTLAPQAEAVHREQVLTAVLERGSWSGVLPYQRADGVTFEAQVTAFLVRDERGRGIARCAIIRDLTEPRRAEDERRKLAAEVIAAQKAALEELGTPLVPIAEGVVVMPLVGVLEPARAERMLGVLLEGIGRQNARVVILDLTGVKEARAEAAEALVRAAQAARLLGAEVVATGTGPELARAFVENGAELGTIVTKGTLRDGVAYALRVTRGHGPVR
ncbi:PAS domain S-box protein [Polyangium sp. y55x31]|uniref:PAS domain S-box protein n=1 Tax=Polyangium sp. y55x31 TaxID=3042688 RepID=UPI0024822D30|nr:PAS domain S-box protein [Polyangium sp. y55x31]MDI1483976.1 PAS domain S-box protein [Polyangium sp. y55x31]